MKTLVAVGIICLLFPLLGSTQFIDPACGIRAKSPLGLRVINGTIAGLTSSPWMAFLHTTTNLFVCGGTLITNRLVLTAAHCLSANTVTANLVARLGEYNRIEEEQCHGSYCTRRIEAKVDRAFRHRLYNPKTMVNDIAILRLIKRVEYTDNIRPICIVRDPRWRKYIDSIDPLTGTGWGKSESESDSTVLRTVDLSRQEAGICLLYTNAYLSNTQFCAGNWDSNLCNGDSGGPVGAMVPYQNSQRFVQIGIASFNNHQCSKASAFTDVLSYTEWILKVVKYHT
ncbi:chymotrypsin-like protease CTRL-1 [Drosophila takahashii]|uniref:chymotrypsin-like protease CTRL-1 n=1 Tax=Drosophila takahashii TaxID=29030 RepID=UPI001CF80D02|nr:chymotrypsin-like protease CTRL-1 [Drosophila takahashii]